MKQLFFFTATILCMQISIQTLNAQAPANNPKPVDPSKTVIQSARNGNLQSTQKTTIRNAGKVQPAPGAITNAVNVNALQVSNLCPYYTAAKSRDFGGGPEVYCNAYLLYREDSTVLFIRIDFEARRGSVWTGMSREYEVKRAPAGKKFGAIYTVTDTYNFPANCTFDFPHPRTRGTYALPSRAYFTGGAAGTEIPGGCNDGYVYSNRKTAANGQPEIAVQGYLFDSISIIGDTGADDVSSDNNCNCDTRIAAINFKPFSVLLINR